MTYEGADSDDLCFVFVCVSVCVCVCVCGCVCLCVCVGGRERARARAKARARKRARKSPASLWVSGTYLLPESDNKRQFKLRSSRDREACRSAGTVPGAVAPESQQQLHGRRWGREACRSAGAVHSAGSPRSHQCMRH